MRVVQTRNDMDHIIKLCFLNLVIPHSGNSYDNTAIIQSGASVVPLNTTHLSPNHEMDPVVGTCKIHIVFPCLYPAVMGNSSISVHDDKIVGC